MPAIALPFWSGAANDDYDKLCQKLESREEWFNVFNFRGNLGFYFHDASETAWYLARDATGCIVRVVGAEQDWELPSEVSFEVLRESQASYILDNKHKTYVLWDAALTGEDAIKHGLGITLDLGRIEIRTLMEETEDRTLVFHLFTQLGKGLGMST